MDHAAAGNAGAPENGRIAMSNQDGKHDRIILKLHIKTANKDGGSDELHTVEAVFEEGAFSAYEADDADVSETQVVPDHTVYQQMHKVKEAFIQAAHDLPELQCIKFDSEVL